MYPRPTASTVATDGSCKVGEKGRWRKHNEKEEEEEEVCQTDSDCHRGGATATANEGASNGSYDPALRRPTPLHYTHSSLNVQEAPTSR